MRKVNPLGTLRESAGLTAAQLAEAAGVTPGAVLRAEQAVYASPPPKILQALWELAPEDDLHDYGILMADYHNYQRIVRIDSYGVLDDKYDFSDAVTVETGPGVFSQHPFVKWRYFSELPSRIAVSKLYCVHPSLIFRFETQPYMCTNPPKELLRALLESGYSVEQLGLFEDAYQRYRTSRSDSIVASPVGSLDD